MKVIIHAGLNKTGSTSVQAAFGAQRELLAKHGFFYPQLDDIGIPGHWALAVFWHDRMDPEDQRHLIERLTRIGGVDQALVEVRRRLLRCLRDAAMYPRGVALLSDEHLGSPNAVAGARRLSALIERLGGEVLVLAYARRDPSLFVSATQHQLKSVSITLGKDIRRHPENVQALRTGFGAERVAVRVFDRDCLEKGDVVADLCGWIAKISGRPMPDLGDVPRVNESISAPGCALLLRLRDRCDRARDARTYSQIRKTLMESLESLPAPRLDLPEGWERRIVSLAHPSWNGVVNLSDHPEHIRERLRMPVLPPEPAISTAELRNWIEAQWDPLFNAAFRAHLAERPDRWVKNALEFVDRFAFN